MSALRAGLLGLGMMGRHHARVLRGLTGVELVGVADRDGDPHGAAVGLPVLPSLEDLLGADLDLCVVAVPTGEHAGAGLELAARGVPALIEKPLADDVRAGAGLVAAFDRAQVVGAVGHVERFNPALRELRRRIAAGDLGQVYQVATRRQGPFPSRVRDVGVVKDLATHDLDLTGWITGSPIASVSARTAFMAGRPHEDLVAVVGTLADGTVTSHLVNWLTPTKERKVIVVGEGGCFEADMLTADLTWYRNGDVSAEWDRISAFRGVSEGDVTRFAIAKPEPLVAELEGFRDAVRDGTGEVVSLADGLRTLVVAEAVLRSAAEQRVVDVAEIAVEFDSLSDAGDA